MGDSGGRVASQVGNGRVASPGCEFMPQERKEKAQTTLSVHFRCSAREFYRFKDFAASVGATTGQLLREMIADMNEGAEVCEKALLHGDVGSA